MEFVDFVISHLPPPPARVRFSGRLSTQEEILGRYELRTEGPVDAAVLDVWESDTTAALERVAQLLRPGGVVVLELPIASRIDEPTRDWLFAQQRALELADVGTREALDARLEEWHARQLPLERLRAELDARFAERESAFAPFLYKELGGPATLPLEESLIQAGAIQAVAFRYAGTRTETTRSEARSR